MLAFFRFIIMSIFWGCVLIGGVIGVLSYLDVGKQEKEDDAEFKCGNSVIMYAMSSSCPMCRSKQMQLKNLSIPHSVHYVDLDPKIKKKMMRRAKDNGVLYINYPMFEISGKLYKSSTPVSTLGEKICF